MLEKKVCEVVEYLKFAHCILAGLHRVTTNASNLSYLPLAIIPFHPSSFIL